MQTMRAISAPKRCAPHVTVTSRTAPRPTHHHCPQQLHHTFSVPRAARYSNISVTQRLGVSVKAQSSSECSPEATSVDKDTSSALIGRRSMGLHTGVVALTAGCGAVGAADVAAAAVAESSDVEITAKVYFDIGVCRDEVGAMQRRTLGASSVCGEVEQMGRIVIGLYGNVTPSTVDNVTALVRADAGAGYKGTVFHSIRPGQYVAAGRQGTKRLGMLTNVNVGSNKDITSSSAFKLDPSRPGNVSLSLVDDLSADTIQNGLSEFVIATGPAPAVDLDGRALVFGRVLEGFDVVGIMSRVPTFKPQNDRVRVMNELAGVLGDDRAEKARAAWDKPRTPIVIMDCGVL